MDPGYNINLAVVERANDTTTDGNLYNIMMEPRSHFALMPTKGAPAISLTSRWQNHKLLGVSTKEYLDQDYAGLVTTNPAVQTYLYLHAQVGTQESPSYANELHIEIEYEVEFYEREELDASLYHTVFNQVHDFLKNGDEKALSSLILKVKEFKKEEALKHLLIKQ